jgi:NAD(P)-dependent dehydrogenase (short-subunit alcohol dehydrogenase family)
MDESWEEMDEEEDMDDESIESIVERMFGSDDEMDFEDEDEMDFEEFSKCLDINLLSQVALVKSLLANLSLSKTNLGIIHVSTGATSRVIDGWSSYSISKAAFAMFLTHLKAELPGVNIQSFEPGVFESKIQEQIRSSLGQQQVEIALPSAEKAAQALFNRI